MSVLRASTVIDVSDTSPCHLQAKIHDNLSAFDRQRRQEPPLRVFADVDDVIARLQPSEPVFCLEPAKLRASAQSFEDFPGRSLFAVKCNPHPLVLQTLFGAGITDFDVASLDEIRLVDGMFGIGAGQFFNNPAKTRPAIKAASQLHGIRFYTADCIDEIEKIIHEVGSRDDLIIAVRLATKPADARYILSTKFGAQPAEAKLMLEHINKKGIQAGISFHVGSQCLAPTAFADAVELAAKVARSAGVELSVLNVGGGFPAAYPGDDVAGREVYFGHLMRSIREACLPRACMVLCEPGRALVADAGKTIVQVVMRRGRNIFINDGIFGTLQELGHPKERRPVRLIRNGGSCISKNAEFKVYGPTCDSNDVLGAAFCLPDDVQEGDWIEIAMMGAYSLSMRTHFNGFFTSNIVSLGN
ncbi:type III PLP-dependent enzyme [Rhizobium tumorigenes]|uniref:type III PLP-dependent enzyme n=1 Tax=Rhizobium tumorigenes TaxID=2041385 RepID=UPI00241CF1C3|nr:type III PLP-dependent enzyme [Rhizobium tumorigenes]WFS04557.1 type III PLP-dependent enzyme [Rhizobium tumorigenes]